MKISLLTGGDDPHYAFPLTSALVECGLTVDFIGSSQMRKSAETLEHQDVFFRDLRGSQEPGASFVEKISRTLKYYYRLINLQLGLW